MVSCRQSPRVSPTYCSVPLPPPLQVRYCNTWECLPTGNNIERKAKGREGDRMKIRMAILRALYQAGLLLGEDFLYTIF